MFDKLKRIFIVEDETAKKSSQENSPSSSTQQESTRQSSSASVDLSTSKEGTPKEKFTNILFGAIEANDIEGFDYLEYKESLQSLAKMNMDEATQYKSAFAMAQTMGATPQLLLESIQHYKNILGKEQSKFAQALENQRSKQIEGEKQRISQLETGIETKRQQLEQLKKQIESDMANLDKAKAGLSSAASRIDSTKANFVASYNMILNQLDSDMQKITTYLK